MKVLIPAPLTNLPLIERLLGQDHEIFSAEGTTEQELAAAVATADALVATGMDVSSAVIEAGRRLQVVGTPQVGFDRIDVDAATRAGVPVISSQGLAATVVAEFTLGLMIALSRRIVQANAELRGPDGWRSRTAYAEPELRLGREVRGSTVGIVGVGTIGSELARLVRALECRVVGFDPVVSAEAMADQGIEKADQLVDLAAQADFVVLHVPLNARTRHLVDAEVLAAMKPGAYLINVARGGVVDETALVSALKREAIAGAALDVFEVEPLPDDSPLYALDQVILTPHIAGVTQQWNELRSRAFAERVNQVLSGTRPDGLANPDVWPAFLSRRQSLLSETR